MRQTRRAEMHLSSVLILLILSVVAKSCDEELQYKKGNECCKKCMPGTKMAPEANCESPICLPCGVGEYRDSYTVETKCKLQKNCDHNLNLQSQTPQSKIKLTPCVCIPGHHCTDRDCHSCVRNTVCQAGERISKAATEMSDTVCESCPHGTYSDHDSASSCKPWTQCSYKEKVRGSSTSDQECEERNYRTPAIIVTVLVVLILLFVGPLGLYLYRRKGRRGSLQLVQKACTFCVIQTPPPPTPPQPVQDDVFIETEPLQQPVNQPQEDTEDLLKVDAPLTPGVSENGMPVIQDNSKSLIVSEAETKPECNL